MYKKTYQVNNLEYETPPKRARKSIKADIYPDRNNVYMTHIPKGARKSIKADICPNRNNVCMTHIPNPHFLEKGKIYGNFERFIQFAEKDLNIENLITFLNSKENVDFPIETNCRCLKYKNSSSGSFKKTFIGLEDEEYNNYILMDTIIGYRAKFSNDKLSLKDVYDNKKIRKKAVANFKDNLKLIQNELTVNNYLASKTEDNIIPFVIAANIYLGDINIYKYENEKNPKKLCNYPELVPRMQILEESASVGNYSPLSNFENDLRFVFIVNPNKLEHYHQSDNDYDKFIKFIYYLYSQNEKKKDDDQSSVKQYFPFNYFTYVNVFFNSVEYTIDIFNFTELFYASLKKYFNDHYLFYENLFQGMYQIHKLGYLHNDLNEGNIFFKRDDDDDSVRFIDFGLSTTINQWMQNCEIFLKNKKYDLIHPIYQKMKEEIQKMGFWLDQSKIDFGDTEHIKWVMMMEMLNVPFFLGIMKSENLNQDTSNFLMMILQTFYHLDTAAYKTDFSNFVNFLSFFNRDILDILMNYNDTKKKYKIPHLIYDSDLKIFRYSSGNELMTEKNVCKNGIFEKSFINDIKLIYKKFQIEVIFRFFEFIAQKYSEKAFINVLV